MQLAKLPAPRGNGLSKSFARVREETQRQQEIYCRKKAEKKVLVQQKMAIQAARKKK